jgi:hypothetical protein
VSIQDLKQNPQDTSNFYLNNTYQATINPRGSGSLPTSPPTFTPPNYAVWVNALWLVSLVISISCALLATLLQQWARRYLNATQPRYSPHKRARIRSYFAEGVDKSLLPWVVEALPAMLHLSLFLFFAGLAVFLWNINLTVFKLVLSWVGLLTALYCCITFIPVVFPDSPYHTPLSLPAWYFVTGIGFLMFQALALLHCFSRETCDRFRLLAEGYSDFLEWGVQRTAEETALSLPPRIDARAFMWTFDRLDEDREIERFFSGLPGLRSSSKAVKEILPSLTSEERDKFLIGMIGLLERTSSSDLLPDQGKLQRIDICTKAIGPAYFPPQSIQWVCRRIVSEDYYVPVQSAEVACLVRSWDDGKRERTAMHIQAMVLSVLVRAQRRNHLWFALASKELKVPEGDLQKPAMDDDSLSLTILIHVIRQQFNLSWTHPQHWPTDEFAKVLEAASKFEVSHASLKLQHDFCVLWNKVVDEARGTAPLLILKPIRNIYLALHVGTNSAPTAFSASTGDEDGDLRFPSSYPSCIVQEHLNLTTHSPDAPNSSAIPRTVQRDNAELPTVHPDAQYPSIAAPVHVDDENHAPRPGNTSVPVPSSHAHWTATESVRDSTTSPNPAAATATQDNPFARTAPPTTREIPTSTTVVPPLAAVSHQNNAVHPGASEIPSSASPENGVTGPSLSLALL